MTRFTDRANAAVEVEAVDLESCSTVQLLAGRVILAAGALGTTRIALRSLEAYDQAVPLVCNEHAYIPSLRLAGVGDGTAPPAHALAQLTAMLDPTGDQQHLVQAQLYSFTGMLLTRLLKESPLAYRESLPLFSTLAPAIVTSVVQHEDRPHPDKYCVLRRGATPLDDALEIRWQPERDCMREARNTRKTLAGLLRRLGCWPLGIIEPGPGSSIHYGGMFAPSDQELPLTVARDGVLRGTRRVHVVDGAGFAYLPAKGPTLTLMANAHRIADAIVFR